MTSAPKSDRITAALGPAMKLAKSTTLSPEKMLSLAIGVSNIVMSISLTAVELGCALFEEGRCALLFIFGSGAEAKIGRLEQQALLLSRLQSLVHSGERELHSHGGVRRDFPQDCLGAREQIRCRHDFVDESDTVSLLRADHLRGKDELQGATLSHQARQTLRATAARYKSQSDFRLAELRRVRCDSDRARHRRLATAAEREAIDRRDHGLAEVLDKIKDLLPETARPLRIERGGMRKLADIGARDKCFVAGACQDDAVYCRVISRALECRSNVCPGRRVQGVEHLGPIDGHVGDGVLLLVEHIGEPERCCGLLLGYWRIH